MAKVSWFGDKVADEIEKKMLDGAEEWMRGDVKTDAEEHCPVKNGILRGTHAVERGDREVVLGVGGPAAPYAKRQHEDASLHHVVGEDHWLEKALERQKSKLPDRVKGKLHF
jgi:hypothetical protein